VRPDGYLWAWDIFFTEQQRTEVPFQAADMLQTNKQVALFTDTEADGAIMGHLWGQQAPRFGYRVVYETQGSYRHCRVLESDCCRSIRTS
jgi:branched-chain amino acid transport system substrate-binding protein